VSALARLRRPFEAEPADTVGFGLDHRTDQLRLGAWLGDSAASIRQLWVSFGLSIRNDPVDAFTVDLFGFKLEPKLLANDACQKPAH
jgi:hypothetical protein